MHFYNNLHASEIMWKLVKKPQNIESLEFNWSEIWTISRKWIHNSFTTSVFKICQWNKILLPHSTIFDSKSTNKHIIRSYLPTWVSNITCFNQITIQCIHYVHICLVWLLSITSWHESPVSGNPVRKESSMSKLANFDMQ